MSKILITGSNGFIGQYLADYLEKNKCFTVINTYREQDKAKKNSFSIGHINAQTHWQNALQGVDSVIHLAARVHIMRETESDPIIEFRAVNTEGTMNLARQAVEAGVKRFIYLSSIKVNGEYTNEQPFFASDQANPQDPYAQSKFEAEQLLLSFGQESGLEVVIIRPPLVYGANVKGNLNRLITLVKSSLPLPLAKVNNRRSLVGIENLCSFIQTTLQHPKAVGEVFLVSDGQDLSTSELFDLIAQALNKKSRLFYLPPGFIRLLAYFLGRSSEYQRLFSSLQVDINKNKSLLGWQPGVSVRQGILQMLDFKE